MEHVSLGLGNSCLLTPKKISDERGFFARLFCKQTFEELGLENRWVQANGSFSKDMYTLRGLHFQLPPFAEVKLVRCTSGSIFDVIVDVRQQSPTYGKWISTILSSSNMSSLYVPKGFAHGFMTLEKNTEITYLVSTPYNKEHERTLLWNDLPIEWPDTPRNISEKDQQGSTLNNLGPIIVD